MLSFLSTISPQVFLHRAPLNAFSAQSVDEFWGFCDPDIGPCTLFYWTSQGLHWPTSPACPGLSGWYSFPPACWLSHTVWCCQRRYLGYANPSAVLLMHRCWTVPVPVLAAVPTPEGHHWLHVGNEPLATSLGVWPASSWVTHSANPPNLKFRDKDVCGGQCQMLYMCHGRWCRLLCPYLPKL